MASILVCPSDIFLATYSLVRSSVLSLPMAMMWIAEFACLSPPRLSLCRYVIPDETGTGATPQRPVRLAQDQGVARKVGRYRQPAPRLPHHEGERPGRRIRQKEVQGAPRGGQRGRRAERRRARLRRQGAAHPYMRRPSLRARRGVVELRLPARRPLQRGDRRPLRRAAEQCGVTHKTALDWRHRVLATISGYLDRYVYLFRVNQARRMRFSCKGGAPYPDGRRDRHDLQQPGVGSASPII